MIFNSRYDLYYNPYNINLLADDEVFLPVEIGMPEVTNDRYLVSNYGRIYSLSTHNFMKLHFNSRGYYFVRLQTRVPNVVYTYPKDVRMHRIVMLVFNYNMHYQSLQINHINGIKTDNRLCNLEWCTAEYNINHRDNVLHKSSRKYENEVIALKEYLRNNDKKDIQLNELSKMFNIPYATLYEILIDNRIYKNVGE